MHHGFAHLTIKVEEIDWDSLAPSNIQSKQLLEEIMQGKDARAESPFYDEDEDDEGDEEEAEEAEEKAEEEKEKAPSPPPPPTA